MAQARHYTFSIAVFLGMLLLTACQSATPEPTTLHPTLPVSATTQPPTLTPTPKLTITLTQPQTPTPTPTPPPQPTDKPAPSPTLPPATLAGLATLDAIVAQHPELQDYYSWDCILYPCYTSGLGLSPNGSWAALFSVENGNGGLKVLSVDGAKQWRIYFSEAYGGDGPGLIAIAHWSLDGRYLYVFPQQDGADGGNDWFWGNGLKLIRLDLETGQWADTKMGQAFSFSPTDRYIAYRAADGIHIYEFRTDTERVFTVPPQFEEFGRFVWSPDSKRLIFAAAFGEIRETGLTTFLLDLETGFLKTVFEHDLRLLSPSAWPEANQILFQEFSGPPTYQLDLTTNELAPVSTP